MATNITANFAESVTQQFQGLAEHVFCSKNETLTSFSFGSDSNTIQAVFASASGLDRWLGDDPKKNLAVVVDLARYGLLQKYVAFTDKSFPEAQCTPIEAQFGGKPERRPPHQLAYREDYHFNASKCGFFGETRPMWEVWGDKLTLQPPSPEERVSEGTDIPQIYWDPEVVCPSWRLLCNMVYPPQFPADDSDETQPRAENNSLPEYWALLPPAQTQNRLQWEIDLSHGQLPDPAKGVVGWGLLSENNPACNARDLWEAERARKNFLQHTRERNFGMGVFSLNANGTLVYTPHDNPDAGVVIPPTLRSELPTPGNGNPSDRNEERMEAFMDKIHPQTRINTSQLARTDNKQHTQETTTTQKTTTPVTSGVGVYGAAVPLVVGAALSALSNL